MASKATETTLHAAMALAFGEIEAATKSANNPHFKSKYADLGAVIDAVKPALIKHGLFFTQHCQPSNGGVIVETVLHHNGGDSLPLGALFVPANKQDAQGFGSALTYARRYGLMTAFGVPAEDDDGNAASRHSANDAPVKDIPVMKEKLEGPYPSISALKGAVKAFASQLAKIEDAGEFAGWMGTPDVVELEKQAMRYLPEWWDTGEGQPPEFEPMTSRIERKRRQLEELDSIANSPAAKMVRAG